MRGFSAGLASRGGPAGIDDQTTGPAGPTGASGTNGADGADGTNNNPATVDLDMDDFAIVNLADPTDDQDAATKKYVDDEIAGVGPGGGADPDELTIGLDADSKLSSLTALHAPVQATNMGDFEEEAEVIVSGGGDVITSDDVDVTLADLATDVFRDTVVIAGNRVCLRDGDTVGIWDVVHAGAAGVTPFSLTRAIDGTLEEGDLITVRDQYWEGQLFFYALFNAAVSRTLVWPLVAYDNGGFDNVTLAPNVNPDGFPIASIRSTVATVAATYLEWTGLSAGAEGGYEITGHIVNDSGGGMQAVLQPNGTTPASALGNRRGNGDSENNTSFNIGGIDTGETLYFRITIWAEPGRKFAFLGESFYGGSTRTTWKFGGECDALTLTSLRVYGGGGNINNGSLGHLRRLGHAGM